jgi:threonine aldolase
MQMPTIDLRSDTVTLPSPEMRRAMADAPLGDDVYGEDPTVNRLERMAAERTGMEAAVLVASGTMGNLCAILAHCGRGDEALVGDESHIYHYEAGGASALGGVAYHVIPTAQDGTLPLELVDSAVRDGRDSHNALTRLLCLENTHNRRGGVVLSSDYMAAARITSRERGLKLHLDGARVFNAAVALKQDVRAITRHVDSVTFCLSKGLAAPVGSVLCGSEAFIARARRARKQLGGGMRQAGVIAAGGLYALNHMIDRLADDHANARRLAAGLRTIGWTVDRDDVETNIFMVESPAGLEGREAAAGLKERGVLVSSPYVGRRMRLVTHYGIEEADIDRALDAFAAVTEGALVRS